ncbi:MAG: hypothetical protein RR248_05265 [Clostridia bacterium]
MNTPIKLLCLILPRNKGETAIKVLSDNSVFFNILTYARGTAPQEIENILGLGDSKVDVVFSLVASTKTKQVLTQLNDKLNLTEVGGGIAFYMPITSMSSLQLYNYCAQTEEN